MWGGELGRWASLDVQRQDVGATRAGRPELVSLCLGLPLAPLPALLQDCDGPGRGEVAAGWQAEVRQCWWAKR